MEQYLNSLLLSKDSNGIKDYLEGLKASEKGLAFEQFLKELYNGNGYTAKRNGGKGDLGADILLYDPKKEGIYCIIQAKNHSSPLSRDDTAIELNKFETLASKKYGCKEFEIISINGFVASALKMKRWRLNLRDWSYVEKLIENYDPNNPPKPNIRLHSHNQTTFDSAIESLHEGSRVACIQATGTGKSYVIAKTMNEFSDEKKLVIAPSHYILKQLTEVVPWLESSTQYMTYKGATKLEESEISELNPKLIVLDEFHRAGAKTWNVGVDRILKNCPEAKVLGTTATPIRYNEDRDMSDELFDEEAVNLPLTEAIQRNILPSPEYVSSLYSLNEEADNLLENISKSALSDEEKKTIKTEVEQAKIDWEKTSGVPQILKKYLNENRNNKFIVFCKNKGHLDELEDEVRKWIRKTKLFEDRETYRVYSGYKKSDANLEAFLEAKDKSTAHILLSIDMLNEGIHAPDVGAVLLFRPTKSARIFYQQIGRCLQVGTDSKPIIFDFVNNFQAIEAGNFLNDLQEANEKERELREEFGLSADYLPEIHVYDESRAIQETFDGINDKLASWEINFQKLVAYKEENGDCLVPYDWERDKYLSHWVAKQRSRKATLRKDQIGKLDEIGFVWNTSEYTWLQQYRKLKIYRQSHDDCLVPRSWKDKRLGSWVTTQRLKKRQGTLAQSKVALLNELGFVWEPDAESWKHQYEKLVVYKKEHGDCLIPSNWNDKNLTVWIRNQRRLKKKGELSEARKSKLDNLGFIWDPQSDRWLKQFQALKSYQNENGDCFVPDRENYKELNSWVQKQRAARKRGSLKADKVKQLDSVGFIWDVLTHTWELQFRKLASYQDKHGDCLVPRNWHDRQLAQWIATQRTAKKSGEISTERIKRLEDLGFSWSPDEEAWEIQFQKLKSYKKNYGDCLVPQRGKDKNLGSWVTTQRLKKNKGELSDTNIARLNDLGFIWDTKKHFWELQFQKLEAYKKEHGDCLVRSNWPDKKLSGFVKRLRESRKKGTLETKRIRELDRIGFNWNPQHHDGAWETQFRKLKEFQTQYGHCRVPTSWDDRLNRWILTNRQSKKKGKLSTERLNRLEQLGFIWEAHQQTWETQFEKLLTYKKEYGDCLVPDKWVTDKTLANWVGNQRQRRKNKTINKDRIKRLDEIGFVWDTKK